MAYEATHRFARISARKVRPLADLIRGKLADDALDILRYQPHRGARMLEKVLHSALANAEDRRAPNLHHLMVTDARVDGGRCSSGCGRTPAAWRRSSRNGCRTFASRWSKPYFPARTEAWVKKSIPSGFAPAS